MNSQLRKIDLVSRRVDAHHIQVVLALITLGLFALGAGAPLAVGGGGI
jgi:hypothetical protein